jgi:PAS domain S-box-containing protein
MEAVGRFSRSFLTSKVLFLKYFYHLATSRKARVSKRTKRPFTNFTVVVVIGLLCAECSAAPSAKGVKRVLIINEFSALASPGINTMDEEIVTELEKSPYQIELYAENLESTLFSDVPSQQEAREGILRKYKDRKPDVLIAIGPAALHFLLESHAEYFPNIPVVFCGSTAEMVDRSKLDSAFTGVWGEAKPEETLKAALRLQPNIKHVVVVGGVADYDRQLEAITKESLRKYESRLEFTYLTDLEMPALLERLRHLPADTIVYHTAISRDSAGTRFIDATQSVPLVAAASNAPVFAVDDVDVRGGVVGGNVMSFAAEGRNAGAMAMRILNGEKPENIPVTNASNVYMFDWRALQHWGLKESDLPAGSVVLNRQPGVWESYKWYIISGISIIVFQATLIAALTWQRSRRRRVENELALTNDRLLMAVEAGKSAGWDTDMKSGHNRWFGDLPTIFGISGESYDGTIGDFRERVHPEDREMVDTKIAKARHEREPYAADFRLIGADGDVRWISARGKFYFTPNGEPERMSGMATDITDRKLAEEALNSLSGQLIRAQEEERSRIAREIHDDYQQRLAMLSIDLEELAGGLEQDSEERARLDELWNRVGELGSDLHSLSHRLHSSTLENLGLVAALRSLCAEFSNHHSIDVHFVEENVRSVVSKEASLCLFRITQEALQNVKKHSGADAAEVRLQVRDQKVHLTVCDHGAGFDLNAVSRQEGMGIRSMAERVRLVGGEFAIHTRPMEGTKIDVWAPVN